MIEWIDLQKSVEEGSPAEVAAALRGRTTAERKALIAPLTAFERQLRADGIVSWPVGQRFAVAAAGLLPGAAALAPWLVRNRPGDDPRWVVEALLDREASWLPDLAGRLAERLSTRTRDPDLWQLTVALIDVSGIAPLDTDGFLFQYVSHGPEWWLRDKPGWAAVVPKMLMVDAVGPQLVRWWGDVISALAAEGLLDRSELLDVCLARLQRGGRASAMAGFLTLHESLAPDLDEIAGLARDYVALLSAALSTVAGRAQEALQQLDRAGRLAPDLFHEASRRLLARTEKKLVRTQLTWLEHVIAREPAQLDALLLIATTAFAHGAADVQDRALTLVLKHLDRASPATRSEISALGADLPPDLAARLGVASAVEQVGAIAWAPREMPPRISTLHELAREILGFFRPSNTTVDAIRIERILAAIVEAAHRDRAALAGALAPVFEKYGWIAPGPANWTNTSELGSPNTYGALGAVIGAAAVAPAPRREPPGRADWVAALERQQRVAPERALMMRMQEIAVGLSFAPRPALVSTPTAASGSIDPEVLAARLRAAAAEGWEPWPLDLAHARLRLPATEPVEATRWEVTRRISHFSYSGHNNIDHTDEVRLHAAAPAVGPVGATQELPHWGSVHWQECWPALLPAHRDVAAAHLLPYLLDQVGGTSGRMPLLPLLAEADGPIGEGMRLALAYGLGAGRPENRVHAVDALLTLAARGQFDGAPLGAVVGHLVAREVIVLNRIVPALRDVARAGAARPVWELTVAALAALWPAAGARPVARLADLIALGVELAQQLEPTETIPGLAEAAARRGSSRVAAEAKRLAAAMPSALVPVGS